MHRVAVRWTLWFVSTLLIPIVFMCHCPLVLGLPEFFDVGGSSKGKKMYKEIRNFIINAFRQNPRVYLSLTACRKMINVRLNDLN